jgi:hypothetical protein
MGDHPSGHGHTPWFALWDVMRRSAAHPEPGILGEYAAVAEQSGSALAADSFPEVATHLAGGCEQCQADVDEIRAALRLPPT